MSNQDNHGRNGQFVKGNQAAAKGRFIADLMWRAHLQDDGKRARATAEKVWDLAAQGEKWAVEFVRDTFDGKPVQQTELSGPDGAAIPVSVGVLWYAGRTAGET